MTASIITADTIPLDDESYHLLNEVLEQRFGLYFPSRRRAILEARLQARLRELRLASFFEYHLYLGADNGEECRELARCVTNNETYFFRERDQMEALMTDGRALLRPGLALGKHLRLLSAGCSSGEEAYTLAFIAERTGVPVSIEAFDLDTERVAIAERGECRARSLRQMTESQIERYLVPTAADRWVVRPAYRERVRFAHGNLVAETTFRGMMPYDAILCRNVFIYFSDAAIQRAVSNLASVLRPGGLLFLGHAESLIGVFDGLEPIRLGRCIAYRKAGW